MATRLYLSAERKDTRLNIVIDEQWHAYSGHKGIMHPTKGFDRMDDPNGGLFYQWAPLSNFYPRKSCGCVMFSPALDGAQLIQGTVKGQAGCFSSVLDGVVNAAVIIKVWSHDLLTCRGTLMQYFPASNISNFPHSPSVDVTNRYIPPSTSVTSVQAQDGDYIVAEIGVTCHSGSSAGEGFFTRWDSVDNDLPEDETTPVSHTGYAPDVYNSWMEFSQTLSFKDIALGTRLYVSSNRWEDPTYPDVSAQWDYGQGSDTGSIHPIKGWDNRYDTWGGVYFSSCSINSTSYPKKGAICRLMSPPLDGNQTISGTIKGQIPCYTLITNGDVSSAVVARVFSGDMLTVRGTLLEYFPSQGTSPWPTSYASVHNHYFPPPNTALSSVSALDGDRIVIEIGGTAYGGTTQNSIRAGRWDGASDDLPPDETTIFSHTGFPPDVYNAWIEFSQILKFDLTGDPTRLFFPSNTTPEVDVSAHIDDTKWHKVDTPVVGMLGEDIISSPWVRKTMTIDPTGTGGQRSMHSQFISLPLRRAYLIEGTVGCQAVCRQNRSDQAPDLCDVEDSMRIYVVSRDGQTFRGELTWHDKSYYPHSGGQGYWTFWYATDNGNARNHCFTYRNPTGEIPDGQWIEAVSSIQCEVGDRIVVEMGALIACSGSPCRDDAGTISFGDLLINAAGDNGGSLPAMVNDADWGDWIPWVEFSQHLEFDPELPAEAAIPPTIVFVNVTDIDCMSAVGNAAIISDGGGTISERGFVWSKSPNPTVNDNKVIVP